MNGWKVTAIIFIILFVLETVFIVWVMNLGMNEVNKEYNCAEVICKDYPVFYYDSRTGRCDCYEGDKIKYSEIMK